MRPLVRSRSPIAEMDQRIGLAGFEGLTASSLSQAHLPEVESPAQGEARGATACDSTAGPAMIQRKVAGGVSKVAFAGATPGPRSSAQPTERGATGTPFGAVLTPSFGRAKMLSGDFIGRNTPSRNDGETDFDGSSDSPYVASMETSSDAVPNDLRATSELSLSPQRSFSRPLDQPGEPVPLEPLPRIPMPRQAEPAYIGESVPASKSETGPHVVIGRITVEVVPSQSATQVPKAPAQPLPVTAASVSKIGPLRTALQSNLFFSLRHR